LEEYIGAYNAFLEECGFAAWSEKYKAGEDLGEPLHQHLKLPEEM
jgi:hypothetical protein